MGGLSQEVDRVENRLAAIQKTMEEQAAEIAVLKKRMLEGRSTPAAKGETTERG